MTYTYYSYLCSTQFNGCQRVRANLFCTYNVVLIDDAVGESDSSPDAESVLKRNIMSSTTNQDILYPAYQPGFINPFKPYHLSYKLTLFRHLWLHTFPTDISGEAMQEHHRKVFMDQDGISPSVSKWFLGIKSLEIAFKQNALSSLL